MRIRHSLAFALLLLAARLAAAHPAAGRHGITIDDMWAIQRVGAPSLSPDGTLAAYTVTAYDMEENRGNADIWIVPVGGGAPRRLTANKASDTQPAWSPDGRRIAFVSKRDDDKAAQIYVIAVGGGEAERITDLPLGASDPKWLPDGKRIVFVSHVVGGSGTPAETKKALEAREKNKVKAHVTENRLYRFWDRWLTDDEFPHLFVVDVATKASTDLTPGSKRLFDFQTGSGSFDVSPDGTTIVFEANATPEPYRTIHTDLFAVSTSGGEVRDLTAGNPADDTTPVFSPDGKSVAYGVRVKAEDWPDRTRLAVLDLASGRTRVLTEAWTDSPGGWRWTPDGKTILFRAEVQARGNLYAIPAAGGTPRLVARGDARQPRGRVRPPRPVGLGRHVRPPALVRRLPVHEPRERRALEPEPVREELQDADARDP
jgi:Tol biopolymer transport system component